ncbi:unnamed protein product [Penicillium egyptiacum]|uniref:Uncharacterized protein n=1 Tax=Penicillium egyptiacum TaxID=1303716 RepID=A0A9W4KM56_9EURO|nr:unnamed protein product [Penicillium egyptiacum]
MTIPRANGKTANGETILVWHLLAVLLKITASAAALMMKVRIAMDQNRDGCKGDGGKAMCCSAVYVTKKKRSYTDSESRLESDVKEFMKDPECGIDAYNFKRDLEGIDFVGLSSERFNHSLSIHRRWDSKPYESMHQLMLDAAFTYAMGAASVEIWNNYVVTAYPNFAINNLHSWLKRNPDWKKQGSADYATLMVCNMDIFNTKLGDEDDVLDCACTRSTCCSSDDDPLCDGEDLDDDDEVDNLEKRTLDKRAGARSSNVPFRSGGMVQWLSLPYRSRGEWPIGHRIWSQAFGYRNDGDCLDTSIGTEIITRASDRSRYDVEHYIELNTPQTFLRDAYAGTLPSGAQPRNPALPRAYIEALNTPMLLNAPPMIGGAASSTPLTRVMNALGSRTNDQHFLVLIAALNGLKSRMWRTIDPYRDSTMTNAINNDDPTVALQNIRSVITVMSYLNDPRARPHMISTANEVRTEFGLSDQQWISNGNDPAYAQDWWDQWFRNRLQYIGTSNRNWAIGQIADMRRIWAVRTGQDVTPVLEVLDEYKAAASEMEIDLDGLD